MKVAASMVAVLAWGSFLAALWVGLMAETRPSMGMLIGTLVLSFLAGVVGPYYLLNLEIRRGAAASPGERGR